MNNKEFVEPRDVDTKDLLCQMTMHCNRLFSEYYQEAMELKNQRLLTEHCWRSALDSLLQMVQHVYRYIMQADDDYVTCQVYEQSATYRITLSTTFNYYLQEFIVKYERDLKHLMKLSQKPEQQKDDTPTE